MNREGDPLPFTLCDGRYHVVSLLAEGGTSRVYLGLDSQTQVWRAIKILHPELATDADIRHRLEVEASAMQALRHPHVLRVFAAGREQGRVWFVMEHAARGSVDDWIVTNGTLPAPAAVEVLLQVCAALGHAHGHGIVHRDITPRNILVDDVGACKVGDFGIARVLEHRITRTGMGLGTLHYMAPEQLDSAKHVDVRADVYAVGCCLYRMLTGRVPQDLFLLRPDDPRLEGVAPALQDVLLRSTRHRPEHRHTNAEELTIALLAARGQMPPLLEAHALLGGKALATPPSFSGHTATLTPAQPDSSVLRRITGLFRGRRE